MRERIGDLGTLIRAALDDRTDVRSIEPLAALALMHYGWPGNLRELVLVIQAAAVLADQGAIRLDHLPAEMQTVRSTTIR